MTTLTAMQTIILDRMKAGELLELTQTGYRLDGVVMRDLDIDALRNAGLIVMQGRERHGYAQFKPTNLPEATA